MSRSIGLLFWRDRLFGMELKAKGKKNWPLFRNMVFEEFGAPSVPVGHEFEWEGKKTLAHLYYSKKRQESSLLVVSVEVGNEMGRAEGQGH